MNQYKWRIFSARDSMLSALYAIARPSVCVSVCQTVYRRKTVDVRMMKFSPYPIRLVLRDKFHPEILRGYPERVRQTREGWVKSAVFYL